MLGLLCSDQTILPLLQVLFQGRLRVAAALGGTRHGDRRQRAAGGDLPPSATSMRVTTPLAGATTVANPFVGTS